MHSDLHTPVLLESVRACFVARHFSDPVVVDATLGLGGHAEMFLECMSSGIFLGFDRDRENLERAKGHLSLKKGSIEINLVGESFSTLGTELQKRKIKGIDAILYDLGVSSVHYDESDRGFSLREDGPLDMRFDRSRGKMASDIVNTLDAPALARIFTLYGEEKKSWFIAQAIVEARRSGSIDTTKKLLHIIERSSFDKKSPIRVFQALRIAVNEEFDHIPLSLEQALSHLKIGGICMVITFHSLEDRLVKQFFAPYLEDCIDDLTGQIRERAHFRKVTKKPIEPTEAEVSENPRSRSAKLRIIERVY